MTTDRRDTEPAPPTPLSEKLAELSRTYGGEPYSAVMATIPAEELRLLYCVVGAARGESVDETAIAVMALDAYKAGR